MKRSEGHINICIYKYWNVFILKIITCYKYIQSLLSAGTRFGGILSDLTLIIIFFIFTLLASFGQGIGGSHFEGPHKVTLVYFLSGCIFRNCSTEISCSNKKMVSYLKA